MKKISDYLLAFCLSLALSACSSGGGSGSAASPGNGTNGGTTSGTTDALTMASKVTVVDAKQSSSVAAASALRIGIFKVSAADLDASSDYNKDKTNVYVEERSAEQFDDINNILCMVGQSKYDAMLNKGAYTALVDQNLCDSSKANASNAGQQSQNQSSSADMPNYTKFTVDSARADNNSPEIVKAWVHQEQSNKDKPMIIYANITITEGVSSTNPYGLFTMNFTGYPVINGTVSTTAAMKGTLRAVRSVPSDPTSKVLLQFASHDNHPDGFCGMMSSERKVTLDRQPDGSAGAGRASMSMSSASNTSPQCNETMELGIAYNSTNFFRQDPLLSVCLNRSNISESSWSYGLYDSTGARVQRNSGFPITYTSGGTTYNGFIGYWGLWIDNNAPALPDGATVDKMDYNSGSSTSTPYTVFKSGGKLKKHTRKTLTLGEIKSLPLGYNEFSSSGTNTNYQVVWDGTHFNKVAEMPQNCSGNCTWSNIPQPYPTIDVTHLQWGNLNFWSQNGGGQFQVPLSNCQFVQGTMTTPGYTTCDAPTNSLQVIFYAEDLVYPGDATVPTSFACYDNCPTIDSNGQAVMSMNMMSGPSMTATNYTFDPHALMLNLGGSPVISTVTNSMQQWGIMTGALFEPSASNLSLLVCPWDAQQTCTWQAQSVLPVYYTWETGPNNWNQFVAIKDPASGAIQKFDPPLEVKYVDGAGTTYLLQYSGFGQLDGIPGMCVNMDTGEKNVDCGSGGANSSIRWVPAFTIPASTGGSLTTVTATDPATSTATTCYVKPLQVEQRMTADPASACATLAATDFSAYTLPDMSLWTDPVAANGTEPVVTAAPAVIGGIVQ